MVVFGMDSTGIFGPYAFCDNFDLFNLLKCQNKKCLMHKQSTSVTSHSMGQSIVMKRWSNLNLIGMLENNGRLL